MIRSKYSNKFGASVLIKSHGFGKPLKLTASIYDLWMGHISSIIFLLSTAMKSRDIYLK